MPQPPASGLDSEHSQRAHEHDHDEHQHGEHGHLGHGEHVEHDEHDHPEATPARLWWLPRWAPSWVNEQVALVVLSGIGLSLGFAGGDLGWPPVVVRACLLLAILA